MSKASESEAACKLKEGAGQVRDKVSEGVSKAIASASDAQASALPPQEPPKSRFHFVLEGLQGAKAVVSNASAATLRAIHATGG